MKGLRRILHIPPSQIDISATNKQVLEIAQKDYGVDLERLSATWKKRNVQLLGHIIRTPLEDPLKQVLFKPGTRVPIIEHIGRRGKAKLNWLTQTYIDAYALTFDEDSPLTFDPTRRDQITQIHHRALSREGIFAQKKKSGIQRHMIDGQYSNSKLILPSWIGYRQMTTHRPV
jgi:hypothetical protein